jgi:rhamnopyranosyl-N-acetylglucosaminyl-diphospho-decaprenol beta-1,3/1,4-galactofuranosyltransferase
MAHEQLLLHLKSLKGAAMTVAAAILTHNRLELLKECVGSLRKQTRVPDEIIIVNNGSTDGTAEWLSSQKDLFVVTQPDNGSSGGFLTAIKTGYERQHDWIYCLDDDAIPLEDALEKISKSPYFFSSDTGFLCGRVVDSERKTYMTPVPIDPFPRWYDTIGESMCIRVGEACFPGLMVSREAVKRCGLPIREFFIMDDDREYSERIARRMPGYCVLDSVVVHYQAKVPTGWGMKQLYQARNRFARIVISDMALHKKAWYIFKYTGWLVMNILFRKYPLRCFVWALWGLFAFRPKIEFVDV